MPLPTLSSIRRRVLPLSLAVGSILVLWIIGSFFYQAFFPQAAKITTYPTSKISPGEPIVVGVAGSQLSQCSLATEIDPSASSSLQVLESTITLTPTDVWPNGATIPIQFLCRDKVVEEFSVEIRTAEELTLPEQAAAQARLDGANARARQEYLEANPFIESYPIRTADYVVRYLEKEKILYVLVKQGISNRELLRTTIRQATNAVGTPEDIPIVFSDEFEQNTTTSTQTPTEL